MVFVRQRHQKRPATERGKRGTSCGSGPRPLTACAQPNALLEMPGPPPVGRRSAIDVRASLPYPIAPCVPATPRLWHEPPGSTVDGPDTPPPNGQAALSWEAVRGPTEGRDPPRLHGHSAVVVGDRLLLLFGTTRVGLYPPAFSESVHWFDVAQQQWGLYKAPQGDRPALRTGSPPTLPLSRRPKHRRPT